MSNVPVLVSQSERGIPYKWQAFMCVAIGTFMAVLDGSVVNIALPTITRSFATDISAVQWVVTTYLLVIASCLLFFGRLGDMFGRKHVYVIGFSVFVIGCGLCSISQGVEQLVISRAFQGVGAAMMMAISQAISTGAFPARERGKAVGSMAMIVAAGSTAGPTIGGLLVGAAGWRGAFYLQVPIGIIGTIMATLVLRKEAPATDERRLDFPGAVALAVTLVTLLLAVGQGETLGWGSPIILALFLVAVIAGALFILIEARVSVPLMRLSLLRSRLFAAANFSALLGFMAASSSTLLVPFYLQHALGYPPAQAGVMLIPQPLMIATVAPFSGRLSDRIGSRFLSSLGMAIICLGLLSLSTLGSGATYVDVLLRLMVLGLGQGIFQSPNNSAILGSVPRSQLGLASSTIATMRNMGMSIGVAIAAAVFASRLGFFAAQEGTSVDAASASSQISAFHDAVIVGALISSIGVVTSLVRGQRVVVGDEEHRPQPTEPSLPAAARR